MEKSPSERGYKPVMLTEADYARLVALKEENSLSSLTSAARKALDLAYAPTTATVDVEGLILFARLDGKTAQRVRDWFGV